MHDRRDRSGCTRLRRPQALHPRALARCRSRFLVSAMQVLVLPRCVSHFTGVPRLLAVFSCSLSQSMGIMLQHNLYVSCRYTISKNIIITRA